MCTKVWDVASASEVNTPREFAAVYGRDAIIWHQFYSEDGGEPDWDELADCCLCPVNVYASAEKVGKAVIEDDGFYTLVA